MPSPGQISYLALPGSRESAKPLRIVVVEDSPDYALLVSEMVRDALGLDTDVRAHASLAASRGSLCLAEADCVLLDLSLPDSAGLDGLGKVQEVAPDVPVVVLSGQDSEAIAVQAVHEGAQDYLVKRNADSHLLGRAIRYAIERKQAELELARRALLDPLTGLANRTLFTDRLKLALARAERHEHSVAVMFLDLDRFKAVNDGLGHDVGDGLLREAAGRLGRLVRPSDTVARFGGDEFLMLCDEIEDSRHAALVAERLSAGLAEPFTIDGHEVYIGASIGIALGADSSTTPEALIRDADQAMYQAKHARARYRLFDGGPNSGPRRLLFESELHKALERQDLRLYYQPEVDLVGKTIFGVEALLRWQHPERGMLPPAEFIPAAEDTGLIVPIGEWVTTTACQQLARWRQEGLCTPELTVSVNLSLRQLCDDGLVDMVDSAIKTAGIPPAALCLEITEAAVAADASRTLEQLEALKRLGVGLSLDDFGVGVSSLSVLDSYPVDMLKIDRSFVQRLAEGLRPRRLFAAIVGVTRSLDLRAVAEGVETKEQLEQIARMGCEAAQGFYLSRPGTAALIGPGLLRPPSAAVV